MKKFAIAAGALLLGTSAYAWAPSAAPIAHDAKAPMAELGAKVPNAVLVAKSNALPEIEPAASSSWLGEETIADEAKTEEVSASWLGADALSDADKVALHDEMATADAAVKEADKADDVESASADLADAPPEPLLENAIDTTSDQGNPDLDLAEAPAGVGGPFEAADTNPRPAEGNYRPCRAGPGDDNCIQLYEPGVRQALAAWEAPTGGLADETQLASAEDTTLAAEMGEGQGGPYEPVDASYAEEELAMNGDGAVADGLGEESLEGMS